MRSIVFLVWIRPRIFKEKLGSIIDGVCVDQALLSPVRYRLYGNAARPGHLRNRKLAAFAEAVESAFSP
jgi:hypothetical protein